MLKRLETGRRETDGDRKAVESWGRQWRQWTYTERVFKAVWRSFLVALAALLSLLAEQQRPLVEEQVSLHRFEASQVLDLCVTFLVFSPDTEGALHEETAQLWQVSLKYSHYRNVWMNHKVRDQLKVNSKFYSLKVRAACSLYCI